MLFDPSLRTLIRGFEKTPEIANCLEEQSYGQMPAH